ncbi:hypothetical protein HKT18_04480 [Flavobacterium sp. IMCC34852]|uniref:Carboxypeptidase-like regulatory domain-containing protein n=2 Tax=Flavobacterium rivulicola TaxID=2732161 RepID=A0A7Y3R7R6_9FLAO|nr:hypothetical protein [Flavobacterium sp. IMCC34852]
MLGKFIITPKPEEIIVSGIVKDATGPLPGANIIIKGTTTLTQTDFNGNFKLKVKKGDILVVDFLGYESKEITVNKTKEEIVVVELDGALTGLIEIKRTFFGRIFHSIGNWFR